MQIFATKKKEEMMEWLRLIKNAVNTSNASLAVGGPIRPFDGPGSAAPTTSPPVSPRSLPAKPTAPADVFAAAIMQMRTPEINAELINSWFDGVSMTDIACTTLIGALLFITEY